jgi:hypothetical protein
MFTIAVGVTTDAMADGSFGVIEAIGSVSDFKDNLSLKRYPSSPPI